MAAAQHISALKKSMRTQGIDAYIIPITDAHMGEYVSAHSKALRWASGFTGSAGLLILTADFAGLWTDSRYFIQAEAELKDSGVHLVKLVIPHTAEYLDWIAKNLSTGQKVAIDGRNFSRNAYKNLQKTCKQAGLDLDGSVDLVSPNWSGRPTLPQGEIFDHATRFAGKSRKEKLKDVRAALTLKTADYLLISSLDDIAWLTNLRGSDIPHMPVFLAHAVIGMREAVLFVGEGKIPTPLQNRLKKDGFKVLPYPAISEYLSTIKKNAKVLLDPQRISQDLPGSLPEGTRIGECTSPTTLMKACKNDTEIAQTRKTMVIDGVVLTKFYYWLDQKLDKGGLTELAAQSQLEKIRKEHGAKEESFGPISAYAAHAAMPHYHAVPASNVSIKRENVYLLDSGGQYESGTTDTTRVLAFGASTAEEKQDYTLVLKGMIACSTQKFPIGTQGYQLDALARCFMWNEGLNYGHGTGHGVGFYLDVHEGPQSIRPTAGKASADSAFRPGMVTSVEPGIYRAGKHGIRIENLVLCIEAEKNDFGAFLTFETLTIAPICTNLVEKSMLTKSELSWLRTYNKWVLRKIGRRLSVEEKEWVKRMTKI